LNTFDKNVRLVKVCINHMNLKLKHAVLVYGCGGAGDMNEMMNFDFLLLIVKTIDTPTLKVS
jgi:hypothetical protein